MHYSTHKKIGYDSGKGCLSSGSMHYKFDSDFCDSHDFEWLASVLV